MHSPQLVVAKGRELSSRKRELDMKESRPHVGGHRSTEYMPAGERSGYYFMPLTTIQVPLPGHRIAARRYTV